MSTIFESTPNDNQLASTLVAGLEVVDQSQIVKFVLYRKFILPVDGFVFWVKADILSESAVANSISLNNVSLNSFPEVVSLANVIMCKGSIHYTTSTDQNESEDVGLVSVVFTSETEIQPLSGVSINSMYIGEIGGIQFAFNQRTSFYQQANLYHYIGNEITPSEHSQIVDSVIDFNATAQVVSNSLPIWLSFTNPTNFPWLQGVPFRIFPSFLVDDNLPSPYISVHNDPSSVEALQSTPFLDSQSNQWQLVKERVNVTTYGLRNAEVLDFIQYVYSSSVMGDAFGISNSPLPKDEKRTISEVSALAMKKTISFEIVYNQGTVREIARQFINSCFVSYGSQAAGNIPIVALVSEAGENLTTEDGASIYEG